MFLIERFKRIKIISFLFKQYIKTNRENQYYKKY